MNKKICDIKMEAVKIRVSKVGKLFWMVFSIPVCLFFYYLFFRMEWWMFFSCLFAFFIELCLVVGATDSEAKVKQTDLIVSSAELPKYLRRERVSGFVLLGFGVILTLVNLVPFFAMSKSFVKLLDKVSGVESYYLSDSDIPVLPVYEGGILVSWLVIGVIFFSWVFIVRILKESFKNAKDINYKYNLILQKKIQERNDGIAKTIEYSSLSEQKITDDKLVYLLCDAKSRMFVLKIKKDIERIAGNTCKVVLSDINADEKITESLVSKATIVLCYIDDSFVNSTSAMKELILASNMNKTIFAALTKNIDSDTHSNISKYVRREFYRLDSMGGYNHMFSDLYPLLGCNEPLASSIGDRYEFEIISEFGFTVKIDENKFNFDSSKKICVYFHSGTHVLTFYKKGRTDLSVVRTLNVMTQNYNSKFVDKRITYNLDALID